MNAWTLDELADARSILAQLSGSFGSFRAGQMDGLVRVLDGCPLPSVRRAVDCWLARSDWGDQKPRNPAPGELLALVPPSERPRRDDTPTEFLAWYSRPCDEFQEWGGDWSRATADGAQRLLGEYLAGRKPTSSASAEDSHRAWVAFLEGLGARVPQAALLEAS